MSKEIVSELEKIKLAVVNLGTWTGVSNREVRDQIESADKNLTLALESQATALNSLTTAINSQGDSQYTLAKGMNRATIAIAIATIVVAIAAVAQAYYQFSA